MIVLEEVCDDVCNPVPDRVIVFDGLTEPLPLCVIVFDGVSDIVPDRVIVFEDVTVRVFVLVAGIDLDCDEVPVCVPVFVGDRDTVCDPLCDEVPVCVTVFVAVTEPVPDVVIVFE